MARMEIRFFESGTQDELINWMKDEGVTDWKFDVDGWEEFKDTHLIGVNSQNVAFQMDREEFKIKFEE